VKYEYFPGDPDSGKGFQWILTASSQEDQRFLSILRDVCMGSPIRPRITGEKHLEKNVPGLPDRPVIALSLTLENANGKPYFPQRGQSMDPSQHVSSEANPGKLISYAAEKQLKLRSGPSGSVIIEE
jgi:hypothetical protein